MVHQREVRDGSVVRLLGCHQEMVVKLVGDVRALCLWFDMEMVPNEFSFLLSELERVSW